ncbi:MAG: M3 family metallopeptidase [Gammaproteobacteria bacterium]|nr:M3 family metallopeptidase [Gammaproteobacteria bacterium]
MKLKLISSLVIMLAVSACAEEKTAEQAKTVIAKEAETTEAQVTQETNILLADWDTPFGIPPFDKVNDEDYMPAVQKAVESMRAEIKAITDNAEEPTFENTIVALEQAGGDLTRIIRLFSNITGTDTNDKLKELQVEIYPMLTREQDAISLNEALFARVDQVYKNRDTLELDMHDARLLELTHLGFVRQGASMDAESKARLKEVNAKISELTTKFSQNLLSETKSFEMFVTNEAELAGLPQNMINAAKLKAEKKDRTDAWLFGLDRATFEGFMTFSENRELRKVMFDGYRARGLNGNDADNSELVLNIAKLRAERARLLGYKTHAHYQLETRMAKTPENTEEFLLKVWKPGLKRAMQDKAEMQLIIEEEGGDFTLAGQDWWHYAEKLRAKKFAFDESQVKPYFELSNVLNGAFYVSEKLFGLSVTELKDTPKWHPEVRVFDVKGANGEHLGVFMIDFYSRDSKRGGAWMSAFRQASDIAGNKVRPIITNNLNITPAAEGDATLLSFDQVNTLFHEFGHGLHGLMTLARYEQYAGTSGSPRDFTEFPAQFLEHYASSPEVLNVYAKHFKTGEVIPSELLDKLQAAGTHNEGFRTTEFIAASLLDLAWHNLNEKELEDIDDMVAFETKVLKDYGLLEEIGPRYRSTYFAHIFSSPNGYSAGYYAYLWSEILDADGFTAFKEAGDIFDKTLAKRLAENVYQAGGREPADELYRKFRLKDPTIEPLLRIRGLD